jgi:hypothetical protein
VLGSLDEISGGSNKQYLIDLQTKAIEYIVKLMFSATQSLSGFQIFRVDEATVFRFRFFFSFVFKKKNILEGNRK